MASIDNFWKRTVTIGSAVSNLSSFPLRTFLTNYLTSQGKSFAATGWRIGWVIGPAHLVQPTLAASTRIVFSCNSPAQEAVGEGLEEALKNGFFETQAKEYMERKAVLMEGLDKLGLP